MVEECSGRVLGLPRPTANALLLKVVEQIYTLPPHASPSAPTTTRYNRPMAGRRTAGQRRGHSVATFGSRRWMSGNIEHAWASACSSVVARLHSPRQVDRGSSGGS